MSRIKTKLMAVVALGVIAGVGATTITASTPSPYRHYAAVGQTQRHYGPVAQVYGGHWKLIRKV